MSTTTVAVVAALGVLIAAVAGLGVLIIVWLRRIDADIERLNRRYDAAPAPRPTMRIPATLPARPPWRPEVSQR